ncbi:MAG: peptide ABC transporter substrate-binding protein [Bacillota bacterium]
MKRFYKTVLFFAVLVLSFSGCADDTAVIVDEITVIERKVVTQTDDTLTIFMQRTKNLNPLHVETLEQDHIFRMICEPLVALDYSDKPTPAIASSWEIDSLGLSATVTIDSTAKWENGEAVTADDVIFSFQNIVSAPSASLYKNTLSYIKSITKTSDSTLNVTFHKVFSGNITSLNFPIISKVQYDSAPNKDFVVPMATGPYRIDSYQDTSQMILLPNENYYREQPEISKIQVEILAGQHTEYHAYNQGILDLLVPENKFLGEMINSSRGAIYDYMSRDFDFVGYNFSTSIFSNKAMRQVVAYALPREKIIKNIYLGYAESAYTPVHPKSWLYEENVVPYNYDTSVAKTLLKNDGWTDENEDGILEKYSGGTEIKLQITILVNEESETRSQIAELLQQELSLIGFSVRLDKVPFEVYETKFKNQDFDLVVGSWNMSKMLDLSQIFHSAGELNYIGYVDIASDILLENAYNAVGEGNTLLAYSRLQQHIAEELPYLSIAYKNQKLYMSKNVRGTIEPTVENPFASIVQWRIEHRS